MLTREERREIEAEMRLHLQKRAACVEALKAVQRHRGWVSDDGIRDVAEFLEMTPEEVDGLATFYNLIYRRPVGRTVLLLCDSVTCWMLGCDRLRDHVTARLGIRMGETTRDGRYTLLPVPCLGACDRAPVMLAGGELVTHLTPQKINGYLEGHGTTSDGPSPRP
jgi:NADH-quinone oxidoreductase subunit E